MSLKSLQARLSSAASGGTGTSSFVLPSMVVEIEPKFVLVARIDRSAHRVRRIGARELATDCLAPNLNQSNVTNPPELQRAVREVAQAVGGGNGRLGLLVPDPAVRVAVLTFETLPDDRQEADALVQWRMKDLLPFSLEEARFSYQILRREPGSVELLTLAAKHSVMSEYENAMGPMNGRPALTLPATAALLPLFHDHDEAGQLLIHVCSGWVTTVVIAGSRLRAWRTQDLSHTNQQDLARDVAREVARVEASSRDHHGVEIKRVQLCARPPAAQALASEVAQAVSCEVQVLEVQSALATNLTAAEGVLFQDFGAAVAGVVSNTGKQE